MSGWATAARGGVHGGTRAWGHGGAGGRGHAHHAGAFTHRDTLRRFSHWSLCSHSLALSLSPNYSDIVGTVLGHRPRRGRRASSSHRRGRALSAPSADGHAHQLFPVLPKIHRAQVPELRLATRPCHCVGAELLPPRELTWQARSLSSTSIRRASGPCSVLPADI